MSVDPGAPGLKQGGKAIRISVVRADGLAKLDVFRLPDPFAVIIVDSEQRHTTSVIKNALNPHWSENFEVMVKGSSVVAVQIFDQRKFKHWQRRQGLLGLVNIHVANYLDLEIGGHEVVQLDLKGSNNQAVQGKLTFSLSTNLSTTTSSSRPFGTSLARTSLPHNSRRSANNASVDNYSVNNYSINYSINNRSVDNNYSAHTASVYTASVNRAPVSEFHSPYISLSRALSSHTTSEVTTPITAIPTTIMSGTDLEQQQSLRNISTRRVNSGGTSTADHPQSPPRPSVPGTVSLGLPVINAQHNLSANEDNAHSTTWIRPSSNQAVDHHVQEGEANTAGLGSLPAGWKERRTPDGRLYYVDHNTRSTSWVDPRRQITGPNGLVTSPQPQATSHRGVLPSGREMRPMPTRRVDHRTTLRPNDSQVPSSLGAIVPESKRNFHRKTIYFRSQPALCFQQHHVHCIIKVRRKHIYEDSYTEIMHQTPDNLKNRLKIMFEGENLLDLGGPAKEFFFLLSHEMFKPFYGLFEYSHNSHKLRINAASVVNPEHNHFKFIGRVLGLGIFHQRLLDAHFSVPFLKMILKKKVTLADLESVDSTLHRRLTWMLDNDITDVIDETFTKMEMRIGEMVTIDLKPGGADIAVTEDNKKEYVDLMVEYHVSKRVKDQFDAFMSGFNELIPQDLIKIFDERELEWLIGGTSEIDVDEWAKFTKYRGCTRKDNVILWFWKCVRSWPAVQRSRLLRFATGTTRIPINGFDDWQGPDGRLRFTITRDEDAKLGQLPRSDTSFNYIYLPQYANYATLEQNLTLAVERVSL